MLRKRPAKFTFAGRFLVDGGLIVYLAATLPVTVMVIVFCSG